MENKVIIKCDGINVSTLYFSGDRVEITVVKEDANDTAKHTALGGK